MMDRRRFAMLLAGSIAASRFSSGQEAGTKGKTVFYSSVGGDLTLYSMDVDAASLVRRNTVTLPVNIQYAWPHPSKQYLYIVSSSLSELTRPRRSQNGTKRTLDAEMSAQ